MELFHSLSLTILFLGFYVASVRGSCNILEKAKVVTCITTVLAPGNLINLDDRKARIDEGDKKCPTDLLKGTCLTYRAFRSCMDAGLWGYPEDCADDVDNQLKLQSFECTGDELYELCGGSSGLLVSLKLLLSLVIFHIIISIL